jgi:hypothetical protein
MVKTKYQVQFKKLNIKKIKKKIEGPRKDEGQNLKRDNERVFIVLYIKYFF